MSDRSVDYLIIGSGVSGLYAAHHLSELGSVLLITKSNVVEANTSYAQGGIASVLASTDSFESHIADTMDAGAGLCDPEAVRILVTEGPGHVRKLMEMGAEFDKNPKGELHLGREGGHSANRIVHSGDLTGREVENVLVDAAKKKGVEILEYTCGVELITEYHVDGEKNPGDKPPACYGAYVYDRNTWEISVIRARATILASGGAGRVYLHNTNPDVATGDGVALAYRAGAVIANMEFYQFHPTSLYMPGEDSFLITEALRGFGAKLLDQTGVRFMERYDSRLELAPRDIVARAIDAEMKRTGAAHVWLDCSDTDQEELMARFPNIYATCLKRGIDIGRQPIPVVPAAHYMCGGVRTDLFGRT
ncbi:MAG: FAD-dependent oxidoreductase, partial [Leptospiraceae bacterium]|nr:FAD-dependent oxidoreductase [Leptospiraceae bacterium]